MELSECSTAAAVWAMSFEAESTPVAMIEIEDDAQLLRAQYGSDFLLAIGIASGLAAVAVGLTKAVKNLAEAARASAEATKAQSESDRAVAETASIWESLNSRGRSDITEAQTALSTNQMRNLAKAVISQELTALGLHGAAGSVVDPVNKSDMGVGPGQLANAVRFLAAYDPNFSIHSE